MKTEKRIIERELMSNEEFEDYLEDNLSTNLNLHTFEAVNKFKSVRKTFFFIEIQYCSITSKLAPTIGMFIGFKLSKFTI